ncbi:expressed unknown protein [Seminavis robusta]|uniref:Uncharacterized protein n=1 Tax=Seminavis robusta TaxID=568900 RepID=A0A9N8HBP6_9STRA|nr:expressed unknown protein [Seminavis robusta]|eukprot:Sro286_g108330.1 n/a (414) ;mRNA; r:42660-43901
MATSMATTMLTMKPTRLSFISESSDGLESADTWATEDSSCEDDDEISSGVYSSSAASQGMAAPTSQQHSSSNDLYSGSTLLLAEKDRQIQQLKLALDAALRDHYILEERVSQQQQQMDILQRFSQQDKQTIARLEEQITRLRDAGFTSAASSVAYTTDDDDDDDCFDDNDSQVRDQIAAVKASLEQGSHQAKANQVSLTQELETSRRLRQKLANRKGCHQAASDRSASSSSPPATPTSTVRYHHNNNPSSNHSLSLTQQIATLVTSVQEQEQYMAEIAQSFQNDKATIPVSLYQAEIQQWKLALKQLQTYNHADDDDNNNTDTRMLQETLEQSSQLLEQANVKLQQLEAALSLAQGESQDSQARAATLFQVVQKLQRDKEEEIHLLDIVMQHLIDLEQQQQQEQQPQRTRKTK